MSEPYGVEFGAAAARDFRKLAASTRTRIRASLERLAVDVAEPGRVKGKRVKTIRGLSDSFQRLRVGEYRVMFEVLDKERTVLIAGIVQRGDLERWLRSR